jgi:hypothetical protein
MCLFHSPETTSHSRLTTVLDFTTYTRCLFLSAPLSTRHHHLDPLTSLQRSPLAANHSDTFKAISIITTRRTNAANSLNDSKSALRAAGICIGNDFAVAGKASNEEARAIAALIALVRLGNLGQPSTPALGPRVSGDFEQAIVLSRVNQSRSVVGDKRGVVLVFPCNLPPVFVLGDGSLEGIVETRCEVVWVVRPDQLCRASIVSFVRDLLAVVARRGSVANSASLLLVVRAVLVERWVHVLPGAREPSAGPKRASREAANRRPKEHTVLNRALRVEVASVDDTDLTDTCFNSGNTKGATFLDTPLAAGGLLPVLVGADVAPDGTDGKGSAAASVVVLPEGLGRGESGEQGDDDGLRGVDHDGDSVGSVWNVW